MIFRGQIEIKQEVHLIKEGDIFKVVLGTDFIEVFDWDSWSGSIDLVE